MGGREQEMKRLKWTVVIWSLVLSFTGLIASCGGGDGVNCNEICTKIVECVAGASESECLTDCNLRKELLKSSVWNDAVACIMNTPCAQLEDPEECMIEAAAKVPESVVDDFVGKICARMKECDSNLDLDQCKTEMKASDEAAILRGLKETVLNCITDCISNTDCSVSDPMDNCAGQCGIPSLD